MDEVSRFRAGRRRFRFGLAPVALLIALLGVFIYYHWLRTPSVESLVRSNVDSSAACSKAGVMVFAGSSTSVYQCSAGAEGWRCFVRVKGDLYDVSSRIKVLKTLDPDVRGFLCG